MTYSTPRRKPRWVIVRENEEARMAAAREALKDPFTVIGARVRASEEFRAALAATQTAIIEFYSQPCTDEELVAQIKARGGRTAIRRQVAKQCGAAQVFLSEMFGYAPLSSFFDSLDLQEFETRGLRARQARAEAETIIGKGEQCSNCGGYDSPNTHDADCWFNPRHPDYHSVRGACDCYPQCQKVVSEAR